MKRRPFKEPHDPAGLIERVRHTSSTRREARPSPSDRGWATLCVDLADVRHKVGLDPSGLADELGQPAQHLVVRDLLQIARVFPEHNTERGSATSSVEPC